MSKNLFYVYLKPDKHDRIDFYRKPKKGEWFTDCCAKGFKEHTGLTLKPTVYTKLEVMVVAHEPAEKA